MKKISYFVSIVFAALVLVLGCPVLVIAQEITEDSGTVTSGALASAAGDTCFSTPRSTLTGVRPETSTSGV